VRTGRRCSGDFIFMGIHSLRLLVKIPFKPMEFVNCDDAELGREKCHCGTFRLD
jgi:hypothetical protein